MEAKLINFSTMGFVGHSESGNFVIMDSGPEFGGQNGGPRPMELVLLGLGGCTGMDVVSLLRKMRVNYDDFQITIKAERAPEHPKVFTKVHLTYHLAGKGIDESKVRRAVELSQNRYCSASAMFRWGAELNWSIEISESSGKG